ncbi:hypothetical protein HOC80_00465 [archaeon]|jgi:hypothetical protein|nr:hypothetical protein [archaeon]MBT4416558.1 hypothetical protein [archaeon]
MSEEIARTLANILYHKPGGYIEVVEDAGAFEVQDVFLGSGKRDFCHSCRDIFFPNERYLVLVQHGGAGFREGKRTPLCYDCCGILQNSRRRITLH